MGINKIFETHWQKQAYPEAIAALYEVWDDTSNSEAERNQANDLASYLERRLIRFTRVAEESLRIGNQDEARSFLDNIPRPIQPEEILWWENYQPLQVLLKQLESDDGSDDKEETGEAISAFNLEESVDDEYSDPKQKRFHSLIQQLQQVPDLKLPDERNIIQELLSEKVKEDLENQPLELRLKVVEADYEQRYGDVQIAYEKYVAVQAELQEYRPKGRVTLLVARANRGLDDVWEKMLPERLKGIREQVAMGDLEAAQQACRELLAVRANVDVEELSREIRNKIEEREDAAKSVRVRLEEIENALSSGDLSRAEKLVEQVRDLPGADKQARKVRLQRQEFEKLVREAEEKSQQLEFAKAVEFYDGALKLDSQNNPVVGARGLADANARKLANIDSLIAEVNEFVRNRERKNSFQKFQEIRTEVQNSNWRRSEINELEIAVRKLEKDYERFKNTLEEAVTSGEIKWPDDMEKWAIDAQQSDDRPEVIQEYVDREVGRFLEIHQMFLSDLDNTILSRGANGLSHSLVQLKEVNTHWQKYLDEPARLEKYTSSQSLQVVSDLARSLINYLPIYEMASDLLKTVDDASETLELAFKNGDGYWVALQIADACLAQRPKKDNPVFDLVNEGYQKLESRRGELQKVYEAGNSSALADAEMHLKLGDFDQAWERLENLQKQDELPVDVKQRLEGLRLDVIACRKLKATFEQAKADWHAGKWDEARAGYQDVGIIFKSTLRAELQKDDYLPKEWENRAAKYREALGKSNRSSEVVSLAAKLERLANQQLDQESLTKLQELKQTAQFDWVTSNDNQYLFGLYRDLSLREMQRKALLDLLQDNREQEAKQFFEKIPRHDIDYNQLSIILNRYAELGPGIEEVNRLLPEAYKEASIFGILEKLREASTHLVDVDKLAVNNTTGARAKQKKQLVTSLLKTMQGVDRKLRRARRHSARQEYSEARQLLADVLGDIPSDPFKALHDAQQIEYNKISKLAGIWKPFLTAIQYADKFLKAGTADGLSEAWQYLGQARDYLSQIPDGLEVQELEQTEQAWLDALEKAVRRAWRAEDYVTVEALLKLGERQISDTLTEYRRLNDRRLALNRLGNHMQDAKLDESEKQLGQLKNLTDAGKIAEVKETGLWERRVTVLRLMREGDELVAQSVSLDQLKDHIDQLEKVIQDVWPDRSKAETIFQKLKLQYANAAVRDLMQNGNLVGALDASEQGAEVDIVESDSNEELIRMRFDLQEQRKMLRNLVDSQRQAERAFRMRDLKSVVEHLQNCISLSTQAVLNRWSDFDDLRKDAVSALLQNARDAEESENYVEALSSFKLLAVLEPNDRRQVDLLTKLRTKLQTLSDEKDALDGLGYRADSRKLRDLLNRLTMVVTRWGLPEAETRWIQDSQTRLWQRVEEIEKADTHVARSWDLLEVAKEGEDARLFDAVYEELRPAQPYSERESYQEVLKAVGIWSRAFMKIQTAIQEYQESDKRMPNKARVAQAIKDFDPKQELQITKTALRLIA